MFKKSIIIILIGVCAVIVSTLSYAIFVKQEAVVPVQPVVNDDNVTGNETNEDDITKDWQVYRNERYEYEIKYPLDWIIETYEEPEKAKKPIRLALHTKDEQKIEDRQESLMASVNCSCN